MMAWVGQIAYQQQDQFVQIINKGGFALRKWYTNHPQLLHNISQDNLEINLDFESKEADTIKN